MEGGLKGLGFWGVVGNNPEKKLKHAKGGERGGESLAHLKNEAG